MFLNQRPQTRQFRGSGNICSTCDRSLQDPYHFCSLSCKVTQNPKPFFFSLSPQTKPPLFSILSPTHFAFFDCPHLGLLFPTVSYRSCRLTISWEQKASCPSTSSSASTSRCLNRVVSSRTVYSRLTRYSNRQARWGRRRVRAPARVPEESDAGLWLALRPPSSWGRSGVAYRCTGQPAGRYTPRFRRFRPAWWTGERALHSGRRCTELVRTDYGLVVAVGDKGGFEGHVRYFMFLFRFPRILRKKSPNFVEKSLSSPFQIQIGHLFLFSFVRVTVTRWPSFINIFSFFGVNFNIFN